MQLKKWIKKFLGHGPVECLPWNDILADRSGNAVELPESPSGILRTEISTFYTLPALPGFSSRRIKGKARYFNGGLALEPDRRLFLLSDAGIAGDSGCVYDPATRTAISESFREWNCPNEESLLLTAPGFPAAEPKEGLAFVAASLGAGGFYHFLHESLPKLLWAESFLSSATHLFTNGTPGSFHRAWMEFFNIDVSKLHYLNGLSHFTFNQILFCSHLVEDMQPNPWSVQQLRQRAHCQDSKKGPLYLWASRKDAESRNPDWEDELLKLMPQFQQVEFSKLSPRETVDLCQQCKVFAGPHGAAFANTVFCPTGSQVIEIFPDKLHSPLYARLASQCSLRHSAVSTDFRGNARHITSVLQSLLDA